MTDSALGKSTLKPLHKAGMGIALLLLSLVVYIPALSAGFIWDDDVYVTENQSLRSAEGLKDLWFHPGVVPQYYPLVHTTFWIEYRLWGGSSGELSAAGFHVTNIFLHGLGAILLWCVLRRLGLGDSVAWLAAAVFAVHPVNVESVAWITERKNVLSLVFYLAALLAYLRFQPLDESTQPSKRSWPFYALALAFFLCALLSKTVTCSLPAAILLLIWWKRGRLEWRDAVPLLPMFVMGLASGIGTAVMEKHVVGAKGADWEYSVIERCLIAGRAVWFYAGKLFWPTELAFIYPRWTISTAQLWQFAYPIAAILFVMALWMLRKQIGRGPLVAVLFFGGTLLPALGFVDVYPFRFSFVADHFQYHAAIGLIVLAVAAVATMIRRSGLAWMSAVFWPVLLGVLAVLTWQQTFIYKDRETLWTDTIHKNPDSFIAHGNLGEVLLMRGKTDAAIAEYERALEIKPDLPEALNTLGVEYARRGDDERAIRHFRATLDADENFAVAHNGLGASLARQGKFDEAIEHLYAAVQALPQLTDARMNLGLALSRTGKLDEAVKQFERVLEQTPNDPKAHYLLGSVQVAQGNDDGAIVHFGRVLELNPRSIEAHFALGMLLMRDGDNAKAVAHLEEVLKLNPNHADAERALESIRNTQAKPPP